MALLDPPDRPDWRSALSTAQFGPIAEDLLAVSIEAAGSGSATIGRPIVDRGVDLYLRRLRSLLTIPIQVKAFQHLTPDGNGRSIYRSLRSVTIPVPIWRSSMFRRPTTSSIDVSF